MPKTTAETTVIYALVDPRDQRVRYVGRAVNPAKRLLAHLTEARRGGGSKKGPWLRELVEASLTPHLLILEEVAADQGEAVEKNWIGRHRAVAPNLLNAHDCQRETEGWQDGQKMLRQMRAAPSAMTPTEVRDFRTSRGLSQAALARLLGVNYAAVSLWESGKRKVSPPMRLAMERLADQI